MTKSLDDLLQRLANEPSSTPDPGLHARVWAAIRRAEDNDAPLAALGRARWIAASAALLVGITLGATARSSERAHELAVFQSSYLMALGEAPE